MSPIEFTVFKGKKDGSFEETKTSKDGLKGDQVLLQITHSGLCGTDEHYRANCQVLGHEAAGIVKEIGPDVKELKAGDRVGYGYVHDTCGRCQECLTGNETFCPERQMYGEADLDQGSMSSHSVWREAFLFKIPDAIPNEYAAPLMCGGATVYNVFDKHGISPTDHIGIVGIGGLGHLAIQFARKWGCEVTVFSGSDSKENEAHELGATNFIAMKGAKELKVDKKINQLIVTTSAQPDWNLLLPILAPRATIYPLSVADGDFSIPYMPMILNGTQIKGSIVAPRAIHKRMLDFAAFHGIKPMIQTFPMDKDGIADAFKHLNDGSMRYRGVLVAKS